MNDVLTVEVGAPAHGGHCVARHDGQVIFVRHALPGERVEVRITGAGPKNRYLMGDAVTILEASPDRVAHPWPQAGPAGVGGAELGHVALPAQREWKQSVLAESFERFARREFPGVVSAVEGDDARGGLGYRTRVSATAGEDGRAAMHPHRSRDLIALESMPLATPLAESLLLGVSAAPGERIQVAVASSGASAVVLGDQEGPTLREAVATPAGDLGFEVSASGFWQVHSGAPALLAAAVQERLGDAAVVGDMYAGAGLLAGAIALTGRRVVAVEADGRGAKALTRNLAAFDDAVAVRSDVRRYLLSEDALAVDTIVLDPPRSGAGAKTLEALADHEPRRIVYVACDPVALARDTALLDGHGYTLEEAQAFDLFPHTHHVEAVATFTRG